MNNEKHQESHPVTVRVRPGRGSSLLLVVVGLMFLAFGVVLTEVGKAEAGSSEPGLWWVITVFEAIWVIGCGAIVVFGLSGLKQRAISAAVLDVDAAPDFEQRLRKLEALKRDGLISEAEFHRKREEFMQERWS